MGVFRFRRFDVLNEKSAMKVNTDGVLLGCLMTVRQSDMISLDVGTGTGTVALIAAQRLETVMAGEGLLQSSAGSFRGRSILAIDIDAPSAEEAVLNFRNSPWDSILSARHQSLSGLRRLSSGEGAVYDHIFSNPPYYDESLQAPDARRNEARHSCSLSYRELAEFSRDFLASDGVLSMVLPADVEHALLRYARMCGLFAFRIVRIRTTPRKKPVRMVVEFSRTRTSALDESMLTIQNEGAYTQEYISLTSDFYMRG